MTASSTPLDALVVGAGPAGLTAAIYLARFKRDFLLVHDGQSRAGWIPCTRNHPGFPEGIEGPELLRRIRRQAEQFGAAIQEGRVEMITRTGDLFVVDVAGRSLRARKILLEASEKAPLQACRSCFVVFEDNPTSCGPMAHLCGCCCLKTRIRRGRSAKAA